MQNKSFNAKILYGLVLVITIVSVFNYYIDPYNVFHNDNHFNFYRPSLNKNHRISKIPELKLMKTKIDAVWIGSSRTGWYSSEEYDSFVAKKTIKNMFINGCSFKETITMAKNAMIIRPEIKEIYIGLDFSMFKTGIEKSNALLPTKSKKLVKEEVLPLLFSLDTFSCSIKTLSKNLKLKKLQRKKDTASIIANFGEEKQVNKKVIHKFKNTIKEYYADCYHNFELDESKVDELKAFIEYANENGKKVVFFITPMHMTERILFEGTNALEDFYKLKVKLAEIQPFYDFATVDEFSTEKISVDMQHFRDAVHAYPRLRKKITNKLFGKDENYGVLITKDNVHKYNEIDKQMFLKYLDENQDAIRLVKEWCK